jgi:hypothetical protein
VGRTFVWVLACALVLAGCTRNDEAEAESVPPEPVEDEEVTAEVEEPDRQALDTEVDDDDRPRSPLTGRPIDEALMERPLLLAKIENSPQARPQSGLDAADVVYEELVEAGITRFFTIFHSELPPEGGPMRSARPVDAQLMSGYGASGFAYSGARQEVQQLLASTPSVRISEGGAGFYRISGRRAPHNLYIDPARTLQGAIDRGAEPFLDTGWVFDEEPPDGALDCLPDEQELAVDGCVDPGAAITIRMSSSYRTGWEYDDEAGVYRRLQNGQPFLVTGEGRIGAANVVVLATRHYVGASGFPETDVTTDDGQAVVLRDGQRYAARWSKPSASDPLLLLTTAGEPFPLKPGPTWVHLPSASSMPGLAD